MKQQPTFTIARQRLTTWWIGLLCVFCLAQAAFAAQTNTKTDAKTPPAKPAAKTNAPPPEIIIPKSVFIDDIKRGGEDPFFWPRSARRAKPNQAVKTEAPAASTSTVLFQGVLGSLKRPLALINGRTFVVNEEQFVPIPTGKALVKCLEIKSNSVVVIINNNPVRQVLPLKGTRTTGP